MVAVYRKPTVEKSTQRPAMRGRSSLLSESFNRGVQTLDEATESARNMAASLERKGLLLRAPSGR
jgi:hypothetical protein